MPRMSYSGTTGATVTYGITASDKSVDTAPTGTGVTADIAGTTRTAYSVVVADAKRGMTIDWYEGGEYIASEEIPVDVPATLEANHGAGSWGETVTGDTTLTHETCIDGVVLGLTTPGATLTLYAASDTTRSTPLRRTTAAADGTWTLPAPSGSLVLVVAKDGFYDSADGDATIEVAITVA